MNPKVLVIMTCDNEPMPESVSSVKEQDYDNFEFLLHKKQPNPTLSRCLNIVEVRNEVREIALTKDADYFLWVDSDIVLPKHAISKFMLNILVTHSTITVVADGKTIPAGTPIKKKHIIGGWYKIKQTPERWVAGRWLPEKKNNAGEVISQIFQYPYVDTGFVRTDFVGLGCAMMSRELLSVIKFTSGLDKFAFNTSVGRELFIGPCVSFGNDCHENGFDMFMDGDIICEHLVTGNESVPNNEQDEIRKVKELYGKPI